MNYIEMYLFIGLVSGITSALLQRKESILAFKTRMGERGIPISFSTLVCWVGGAAITTIILTTFLWPLKPSIKILKWSLGWANNHLGNYLNRHDSQEKRNQRTVSEIDRHMKRAIELGISTPEDMEKFLQEAMPGKDIKIRKVEITPELASDPQGLQKLRELLEKLGPPSSRGNSEIRKVDLGILGEFKRFSRTKDLRTLWTKQHLQQAKEKETHH